MSQPWAPPPDPHAPESQAQSTHIAQVGATQQHSHNGNSSAVPAPKPRGGVPPLLTVGAVILVIAPFFMFSNVFGGWFMTWFVATSTCFEGGGAWSCLNTEATWMQALYPVISAVVALSMARAAWIEGRQGRAIGFVYLIVGLGALLTAWSLGAA
ncbi:MAG: hypothetical protein ACK5KU_03495 [Beutenbergiaceae bacterium]